MRVGIIGCSGRMGKLIEACVQKDSFYHVGPGFSRTSRYSLLDVVMENDLLVDFSAPQVTFELLNILSKHPKPVLIGTSGLDQWPQISSLCSNIARQASVVVCANTSLGACMQNMLVRMLATYLDSSYDIRVREVHHRNKQDAVSGTAKRLIHTIVETKHNIHNENYCTTTTSEEECQKERRIEVHASRVGNVFGEHEVSFVHCDEEITVRHTAHSRKVFVDGVMRILLGLRDMQWRPGLYEAESFFKLFSYHWQQNKSECQVGS